MEYKWNLHIIYGNDEEWLKGKEDLLKDIDEFNHIMSSLTNSVEDFLTVTKLKVLIDEKIERVYCYPRRFLDLDIEDKQHKEAFNEALNIYQSILKHTSAFESLAIEHKKEIEEFLKDENASYYKRYYEIMFAKCLHVSSNDDWFKNYQIIRNEYQSLISELEFGKINVNGKDIVVNNDGYSNLLLNEDRGVRKSAYNAINEAYLSVADEITNLFLRKLKNDIESAKNKGYDSLMSMKMSELELPRTLINESIDAFPSKGKRTNDFTGITYAGIPYVCLNFTGKKAGVRALIHELGHAVHLLYSKENNDFTYFEFSLFLTEVVAKVNEAIFNNSGNLDDADLLSILSTQLNSIFNQIMFTEFEMRIVNLLENNEHVDKDIISHIYEELLKKYNGSALTIGEYDKYGWLRISHFIMQESFYLYQYSLGTMLANKIYHKLSSDDNYKETYISMLGIGNKMNIIDSLKSVEIDLFDKTILDDSFNNLDVMIKKLKKNQS